ncbi:MAG: hypothetical protein HY422_02310 [Candidatus Komeilibacteria bacterium]|nr:hypothetical protein [Candidatus Komeilibacteria bacterium]
MQKFLIISYWFESAPGDLDLRFWRAALIGAAIFIVIGIAASFMIRRYKNDRLHRRVWVKIASWSFTIAPLVVLLWFFRLQHAYFLSMRFLVLLWLLLALVWAVMIAWFAFRVLPRRLKERSSQEAMDRYLPHKK